MKILLATDGSNFSDAAVNICPKIVVDLENTHFRIVSAVAFPVLPIAAEAVPVSAEYYDWIEQSGRLLAREFLDAAASRLCALFPGVTLDLQTQILDGSPPRVIIEEAESWNADLIVIGSHGYGFWSRALLGSVSTAIVHHANCSVLVVRAEHDLNKLA